MKKSVMVLALALTVVMSIGFSTMALARCHDGSGGYCDTYRQGSRY